MDLSKVYDCIPHDFLIVKLECYGIDKIGLSSILDYLSRRKQRTKTGSSQSSWYDIVRGVPQGPILGPFIFNIFINDLFFVTTLSEICNFADDNTLYSSNKELQIVFRILNLVSMFQFCSTLTHYKQIQASFSLWFWEQKKLIPSS